MKNYKIKNMARLEDKIAEIADARLRQGIAAEVAELKKKTRFGLVFEGHQPEVVPLYARRVKLQERVARRTSSLAETWKVLVIYDGIAECVKDADESQRERIPVDQLVVVRRVGQLIFPALTPMGAVANGDPQAPHHILIEADNYHALQLLLFPYEGKVDCIYIDPPYNSGARDWKYNNDYVDSNDTWRHSKWLAFMLRRLRIARRLLKDNGVLIVTVDENEIYHLGCLLEQEFPAYLRQMLTLVINPKGTGKYNFARVEEHAMYCIPNLGRSVITGISFGVSRDDEDSEEDEDTIDKQLFDPSIAASSGLWELRHARRRGRESSYRHQRPNQFYPIYIDENKGVVIKVEPSLPLGASPDFRKRDNLRPIWPIDEEGNHRCWRFVPDSMQRLIDSHRVVLGKYNKKRDTWTLNIWEPKNIAIKEPLQKSTI